MHVKWLLIFCLAHIAGLNTRQADLTDFMCLVSWCDVHYNTTKYDAQFVFTQICVVGALDCICYLYLLKLNVR